MDTATAKQELSNEQMSNILDKLGKLQTLADRAGTVHEAASAAAKIQRLLLKHNLTMAQVYARTAQSDDPTIGFERQFINLGVMTSWLLEWRRNLLTSIGLANFCRIVSYDGTSRSVIIGRPQNVKVVPLIYEFLTEAIMKIAQALYKRRVERGLSTGTQMDKKMWKESFYLGAVITVRERFMEQLRNDSIELNANALVKSEDDAVDKAMGGMYKNIKYAPATEHKVDWTAYSEGLRAGRKISLDKQVTEGETDATT